MYILYFQEIIRSISVFTPSQRVVLLLIKLNTEHTMVMSWVVQLHSMWVLM